MGRRAKITSYTEQQKELDKQLEDAKAKADAYRQKRALEIGMIAIKVGAGDMTDDAIHRCFVNALQIKK